MSRVTIRARFDDRAHMESAVHALLDEGFKKRAIQVARSTASGHRAPEGSSAMRIGGIVGAILGAGAVAVAIATLPTAAPFWSIAFRLLAAIAGGALAGALGGLILSGSRDRRNLEDEGGPRGWLVRVTTDVADADHAQDILRTHHGHA